MKVVKLFGRIRMWAVASLALVSLGLGQPLWSQVVLNELMADNQTALDNGDDFPDYIEIYNPSAVPVDLVGMRLSDDPLNNAKFVFRPNTIVPAGGYLVVFADDKIDSPGIHTGFGLNNSGESLTLYNPSGFFLDGITFGLQLPDLSIGRVPNGAGAWTLTAPTPGDPNEAAMLGGPELLSINEWMALNTDSVGNVQDDWFELYSGTNLPVNLGGLILSDANVAHAIPALSFIGPLEFIRFWADDRPDRGADHLPFKLSSTSGETLTLYNRDAVTVINRVTFPGGQQANQSQGRLPDGAAPPYVYFPVDRDTPGRSNFLPITNVVFNEVLSHTDPPLEDALELYNPTAQDVDISGWWLSDNRGDPKRFRIPPDTIVPAGGFKVFYQIQFDPFGTGIPPYFSFNSFLGEEINLFSSYPNGDLSGFRLREDFGAAENGVSFGRYVTSHSTNFVPMKARTFGQDNPVSLPQFRLGTGLPNSEPKVGPLAVTEIMYHPPDIVVGTNVFDNSLDEYIELRNITTNDLRLFDPNFPTNTWKLRDAVSYSFPQNLTLPPGGTLLVVNFDPTTNAAQLAVFRNKYKVNENVPIFGAYRGKLSNSGESVEIAKPDPPQTSGDLIGYTPYLLVERIKYSDDPPWPPAADGTGLALRRIDPGAYGNDAINWIAAAPSPGHDEIHIEAAEMTATSFRFRFNATIGRSYTVRYRDHLAVGGWMVLSNCPPQATGGAVEVVDTGVSGHTSRFYQVVTPTP